MHHSTTNKGDGTVEEGAPLVSVLMAAHNEEEHVGHAAKSILTQTVTDLELIVVDDGSTDGTPGILRSIQDPRLHLFRAETNLGRSSARNWALEKAQGSYLAFMDADDISLPGRLETQLQFLKARPEIDVCATALTTFGGDAEEIWRPPGNPERIRAQLLFECPLFLPTALFHREVFENPRIRFNPEFNDAEDYDFWTRLSCHVKIANLQEVFYRYRYDPKRRAQDREKKRQESIQVQKRELKALGIVPTPRELHLLSAMSKPPGYVLKSSRDVAELISWLDLLLASNREKNVYSQQALLETIEARLDEILGPVPGRRMGLLRRLDSNIVQRRFLRKLQHFTTGRF